jgi:hypothetical protein
VKERDSELELLNRALAQDIGEDPDWWKSFLTRTLRLPLAGYFVLKHVLAREGWRKSPRPIGYVKKATTRIARRAGWLEDATDAPQPFTDGTRVWGFISRTDTEMAREEARGLGAQFLAHDLALERLEYEAEEKDRRAFSVTDILKAYRVDWHAVLNEIKDDELRRYIACRLLGTAGGSHSEATRKRFQRSLPVLQKLITRHIMLDDSTSVESEVEEQREAA